MTGFRSHLSTLPEAQRQLWPSLRGAAALGWVLYGGTAIALRLGHRISVDFDFFSSQPLDREALRQRMPFLKEATVLQDEPNSWTLTMPVGHALRDHVKVSFYGDIGFGRLGDPERSADDVLLVASLSDLMATKLKVLLQRAEAKDYRDIAAMVKEGVSLSRGLAGARELYGPSFQPSVAIKALTYFKDGDLSTLSAEEQRTLVNAAKLVRELPAVSLRSKDLSSLTAWNSDPEP